MIHDGPPAGTKLHQEYGNIGPYNRAVLSQGTDVMLRRRIKDIVINSVRLVNCMSVKVFILFIQLCGVCSPMAFTVIWLKPQSVEAGCAQRTSAAGYLFGVKLISKLIPFMTLTDVIHVAAIASLLKSVPLWN